LGGGDRIKGMQGKRDTSSPEALRAFLYDLAIIVAAFTGVVVLLRFVVESV
jgi:hypothetical protein